MKCIRSRVVADSNYDAIDLMNNYDFRKLTEILFNAIDNNKHYTLRTLIKHSNTTNIQITNSKYNSLQEFVSIIKNKDKLLYSLFIYFDFMKTQMTIKMSKYYEDTPHFNKSYSLIALHHLLKACHILFERSLIGNVLKHNITLSFTEKEINNVFRNGTYNEIVKFLNEVEQIDKENIVTEFELLAHSIESQRSNNLVKTPNPIIQTETTDTNISINESILPNSYIKEIKTQNDNNNENLSLSEAIDLLIKLKETMPNIKLKLILEKVNE